MKKFLAATAILTLLAGAAFAYGPYGYGPGYGKGAGFQRPCQMGQGMGAGMGPGMMRGGKGFAAGTTVQAISEADAKKAVENYIATNLKGFSIKDTQKVQVPRGTAYFYTVSDGKNTFQVHVNPFGNVRGPFPVAQSK